MELERREQGAGLADRPGRFRWWRTWVLSTLTPQSGWVQWTTGSFEGILGPCSRHYREYHLNGWPHCLYQGYYFKREHENFRCSLLVIFFLGKNCILYKHGHFSPGSDWDLRRSHPIRVWLAVAACWLAPRAVYLCVCVFMCMCCHLILTSLLLIII